MRRVVTASILLPVLATGCVSIAEHRKLERQVYQMRRADPGREQIADFGAELDAIQRRLAELEGRIDEAQHDADQALEEARRARLEAAGTPASELPPAEGSSGVADDAAREAAPHVAAVAPSSMAGSEPEAPPPGASASEVSAYREAHAAWRSGDLGACVDRFRSFLQTYPASPYADDAAYWMAECHFKQGDYKAAILRFDDVVARYPEGDKSADALYRQGEALLRLGPGYAKAAGKAFERVISEYPDSPRVPEARKQLDLLGSG